MERIKRILNKLNQVWKRVPEQRFFQLLFNYTSLGTRKRIDIADPFYYSDEMIEKELDLILEGEKE